jgi:hypothetical protein
MGSTAALTLTKLDLEFSNVGFTSTSGELFNISSFNKRHWKSGKFA